MKYLSFLLLSCVLVACNVEKSRDEQLKELLLANVRKGLSADALQKVDSITLVRVDSFTERGKMSLHIEETEKRLEGSRRARSFMADQLNKYGTREYWRANSRNNGDVKQGWDIDSSAFAILQEEIMTDSLALDSLRRKYERAPVNQFAGCYIVATVYFTFKHVSDTATIDHYLYNNDDMQDTHNLLLRELEWRKTVKDDK